MTKALVFAVTISAMIVCNASSAAPNERGTHSGWNVHQPTRFMVSGVLRKNGTTDVIKPIHGIVVAETNEAAVATFAKTAVAQYSGYTLIATLASPVPVVGTCENSI